MVGCRQALRLLCPAGFWRALLPSSSPLPSMAQTPSSSRGCGCRVALWACMHPNLASTFACPDGRTAWACGASAPCRGHTQVHSCACPCPANGHWWNSAIRTVTAGWHLVRKKRRSLPVFELRSPDSRNVLGLKGPSQTILSNTAAMSISS